MQSIVVGAGGHGHSVAEIIMHVKEFNLVGLVDDSFTPNTTQRDSPILDNY